MLIFLEEILSKLIRLGIGERNDNNFNRFRLVIISDNITEIGYIAQKFFNQFNLDDEKVHLHVMQQRDIGL